MAENLCYTDSLRWDGMGFLCQQEIADQQEVETRDWDEKLRREVKRRCQEISKWEIEERSKGEIKRIYGWCSLLSHCRDGGLDVHCIACQHVNMYSVYIVRVHLSSTFATDSQSSVSCMHYVLRQKSITLADCQGASPKLKEVCSWFESSNPR